MNTTALAQLVTNYETPVRPAMSGRFPFLKKPIIAVRRLAKKTSNTMNFGIARKKSSIFFPNVVARHQSVLIRKLGDSDQTLQENKITNLKRACEDLNGLIVHPNQTFSLWETIGNPTYRRGYTDGMLLSGGKVTKGVGGGLCQLSNFLCWIFLHADVKIIERTHHSKDVFPDSGRVLPFGSGATCLFNFIDFQVKNIGKTPLQLKIWVTGTHLKGQLVSTEKKRATFSIQEQNHLFIKKQDTFFRYNEIWRIEKLEGKEISRNLIFTNFAPVLYKIDEAYCQSRNYRLLDFSCLSHSQTEMSTRRTV